MPHFELLPGTPGLELPDVAHVMIPGRGRKATGEHLARASYNRVDHAAALYVEQNLAERGGRIVCSGYKTPGDMHGELWSPQDTPTETFVGIPESDLMRRELVARGIASSAVYCCPN
jgi:hypothetical protein